MESITLKATPREILGKKVKVLRDKGQIPAILYGKKFKNIPLLLDKTEFEKVYKEAEGSTIIDLNYNDKSEKILIREPQKNPVTGENIHVDLYRVDMTQEIHTEIPLEFIGVSPAVENLEGNLITNKDALEIECLPDKLVQNINVDISALQTFEDLIKVKDLNVPEGINVLDDPEEIVAQVTPPRSEEELEAMEQETTAEAEKAGIESIEAEAETEKEEKKAEKEASESEGEVPTATQKETSSEQPSKESK
ncbi:hypothetical protein A2V71_04800 [Candidatus Berkelbacteria bacterium RBG_13_40_8]|uniref:Large ribosomal subunit protein bL25 n=1 Tax=Candidatus Berkelbacteria bacterium RBG_13_40_8 TaxID=1797467 RepID=A0A1F5DML8_9BACT|nr:MAG: hypothetical protein A2V71_04800 [Candidatus Berkelbacteria bacterium RBG_13_40_8]